MKELFDKVSVTCSKITTNNYSTSFSLGVRLLGKELRDPIYSVYGYVRFADEIVDTFHDYDKEKLLKEFKYETYRAIHRGISLNPIINSFQNTVNTYNIDLGLIETFLESMEMDISYKNYNEKDFKKYLLGSSEVVGLMCLKIFCNGNDEKYNKLKSPAMALGSAFQKINFLRDVKKDLEDLGRSYFPQIDLQALNEKQKKEIEESIKGDFHYAFNGIKKLPRQARFGVYLAYVYYYALFQKIQNTPPSRILKERIRIPNNKKYGLLLSSYIRYRLNLL